MGGRVKCVVLAAGEGKRMRPLTATRPKVMLPVAGKPILEHVIANARDAGFKEFVLVTHYKADVVRKHVGDGKRLGVKVQYVDQGTAGGTGHAVAALRAKVKKPFALVYGDSYFSKEDLVRLREAEDLAVAAKRVDDARAYGLLKVTKKRLQAVEEKPRVEQAGWVNAGAYRLTPDMVRRCAELTASPRGEFELTDVLHSAARERSIQVIEAKSWRDAGRPWHLLSIQEELMAKQEGARGGTIDQGAHVDDNVVVEKGARVRSGVVVEGPSIIQARARVGPNAYIRPSTVVGAGCHVGHGVEIKNSILMQNAHVPHLSYVGDSVIGQGVNLGAGTQVANLKHSDRTVRVRDGDGQMVDTGRRKFGVVIGDGAKTGINSTLNVGSVLGFRARILPGRVVDGWVPDEAWVA